MIGGIAGGPPPSVVVSNIDPEKAKYENIWKSKAYRQHAPGEEGVTAFMEVARPKPGSTVIDFGAGTGRPALLLAILGQCKVHMVDIASNCLDEDVENALTTQSEVLSFTQHNMIRPLQIHAQYGYCSDFMEHIREDDIGQILSNILVAAQHVFFVIATEKDVMGEKLIGEPLHLTVRPHSWWLKKFQEMGCVVHWSKEYKDHCDFYVTMWENFDDVPFEGHLNTEQQKICDNVRSSISKGYRQVSPHIMSDVEVCILGGGPSLAGFADDIRQKKAEGAKIVTLNGAYNWAIENGLGPVTQIMVDAREFNKRFVDPPREDCLYMLASQCDPAVFEHLPKERVILWHTSTEWIQDILEEGYAGEPWYGIPGGSTVLLRAIPLLRMLGFSKFHLYGCDSALSGLDHHAYTQPENDSPTVVPVSVDGRVFHCHPWMVSQAKEFMDLIKGMGDLFELEIYGDGLLAHILETGAKLGE